jgi:hypothetical protein
MQDMKKETKPAKGKPASEWKMENSSADKKKDSKIMKGNKAC